MIAEQEEAGHELYPNMLKNREFANAEYHRFDSEKTGLLFAIGAVFLESKMRFSAKAKIDSSTGLGIHSIFFAVMAALATIRNEWAGTDTKTLTGL